MGDIRLTVRVDLGPDAAIGPGKVRLLEAVRQTGSISEAGRSLGMSYRRAWLLIDDMNRCFRKPVVAAQRGGSQGGGAALTAFGDDLVRNYRAIETDAMAATAPRLRKLQASLQRVSRSGSQKPLKTSIRRPTQATRRAK